MESEISKLNDMRVTLERAGRQLKEIVSVLERENVEHRETPPALFDWMQSNLQLQDGAKCRASELFQNWQTWAHGKGIAPQTQTWFGREIGRVFRKKKVNGIVLYEGLKPRQILPEA
jgi:hypothetical protein